MYVSTRILVISGCYNRILWTEWLTRQFLSHSLEAGGARAEYQYDWVFGEGPLSSQTASFSVFSHGRELVSLGIHPNDLI